MPQKENSFLTLKQQLKSGKTGNLYLFFGEEVFIKDTYTKYMQSLVPDDSFADFNRIFLDGKTAMERIDDAVDAFPVMAEKKIIVVKDSGIFKARAEGGEEAREFWLERLKNLPDFVIVIFDEQEVDKRSALYKAVQKSGLAVEFNYLESYELVAWIVREAQKSGKKISKSTAEYLLSLCDPGISNVKNELDKLINYLLKLQENKVSAFNILYLLSSNFDKLLRCKLLLAEGASPDVIAAKIKLSPYVTRKYITDCKGFSEDFLIARICKTAEFDLAIKQGVTDEQTALMQYVFEAML